MSLAKRGTMLILLASLAMGAWAQFDRAELTETIDRLRQEVVQNPGSVDTWIDLGQAYLDASELERINLNVDPLEAARESFIEAIALDYRNGDAHLGLGLAEFERGDFVTALFEFNEVTRLFPDRFDGHYNRAVTLARLQRPDEAVTAFRAALERRDQASDARVVETFLGIARQLRLLENYAEVAAAYESALELRSGDEELIFLRSEAQYLAGNGLEALPELTELEATSNDFQVSALIADIYVEAGQVERAQRALERARRIAEEQGERVEEANILVKLAILQRDSGRNGEAVRILLNATDTDPLSWQAFYNLGISYLESGQSRSARNSLENALALNRSSGELYLALATAYDRLNEPQDALRSAQAALQRFRNEPELETEARFVVGRSLYRLGSYQEALLTLERVVAAEPENGPAQLWAGLAEYQLGNYEDAVQFLERAAQLDPNSIEALINLGASYLASEQYSDAEVIYNEIIDLTGGDPETFYNLGWSLLLQGQRESAQEAWRQSLALNYTPAREALDEYF